MNRALAFIVAELVCMVCMFASFGHRGWFLVWFMSVWFFGLCAMIEFVRVAWQKE